MRRDQGGSMLLYHLDLFLEPQFSGSSLHQSVACGESSVRTSFFRIISSPTSPLTFNTCVTQLMRLVNREKCCLQGDQL